MRTIITEIENFLRWLFYKIIIAPMAVWKNSKEL